MTKRNIVVYVSGKYSDTSKELINQNIKIAREVSIKLWELGFTVICPHLNTANFEKDCNIVWKDYVDGDLEILRRCNVVLFLDNYKVSEGALKEQEEAIKNNIPCFYNIDDLVKKYKYYEK